MNRTDYGAKTGERYEAVRPRDSDVLKGDGSFTGLTQHDLDFQPGKGERYEMVKRDADPSWKVNSS